MLDKKILLFLALTTILFVSCKQKEPEVINDSQWKFYAACNGEDKWVAQELYYYVLKAYNQKESETTYSEKDLRHLELLKDNNDVEYDEKITTRELYRFVTRGEIPESNEEEASEKVSYDTDLFDIFLDALFTEGNKKNKLSKSRALQIAYEICDGDFSSFVQKISSSVRVYEYKKDKELSTKDLVVYDVAYLVDIPSMIDDEYDVRMPLHYTDVYVRCTIEEENNGDSSIKYVHSSSMYSELYSSELDLY